MRRPLLVLLACAIVAAGVYLLYPKAPATAPDGDADQAPTDVAKCGAVLEPRTDLAPPQLASHAAADLAEGGNRTWRWDLTVGSACRLQDATAFVELRPGRHLEGCGVASWRASVTTGVHEEPIALEGDSVLLGQATFTPSRAEAGDGPGSFVVSIAVTMASSGLDVQDSQCLDAAINGMALAARAAEPRA